MLKIKNNNIDLILQAEEHTNIQKILSRLTLENEQILIICPNLFLERFIQFNEDYFTPNMIEEIGDKIEKSNGFVSIELRYKNKYFTFHFILLSSEKKVISNPFKGEQLYNVAFKEIQID
jgi:hypothetical protein